MTPYNTRRKSLSLSELGIQVPKRARAPSHPSPLATMTNGDERPAKKPKSSLGSASPPPGTMSPPKTTNIRLTTEQPKSVVQNVVRGGAEHTPPPSPGAVDVPRVDTEGIKDDIVVGVIRQLEKTGNRPHTSKELAAVLATCVTTIETSTNPNALIQARLAAYLKGPWPLVSPCPLGKQQENIHPRRVFYFLTTSPHQPIPETSHPVHAARRVVSPSLSSATDDAEAKYLRGRTQLSPSPEVDLSSPELDEHEISDSSTSAFSARSSLPRDHPPTTSNLAHNRRADSPPLEREERDFKQTANELQEQRRNSQEQAEPATSALTMAIQDNDETMSVTMSVETEDDDETEESALLRNTEAAATLFGNTSHLSSSVSTIYDLSSPILRPLDLPMQLGTKSVPAIVDIDSLSIWHDHTEPETIFLDLGKNADVMDTWTAWSETGELQSPENIELDELECLFDAY